MEIIEQIGSYAGLAAIVGLAVLSALYFSQARDVRRLREAEEGRLPSAAPPQPARQPAPAKVAAVPAPKRPEPQPTGVTRVGPAAPVGAAPAGGEGTSQSATGEQAGAQAPAAGQAPPPAPPKPADVPAAAGAASAAPAPPGTPVKGGNAGGRPTARPLPPRPPARPPGAAALRLGQASALRRAPWYRRLEPRYLVLIAAGALVLGIGGVVGIVTLAEDEAAVTDRAPGGDEAGDAAPLDPSTITVSVLNGTSVEGAADQVAGTVESAGYQRGNVDNAAEPSAESVVLFAEGAKPAARQVGRELDISQLELIDPETQSLVGTADVTVVVGADRAQQ